MDPLSITASVTAVATLAAQIIVGGNNIWKDIKNADKEAADFFARVQGLAGNLKRLQVFLASHADQELVFNANSMLSTSIYACWSRLAKLKDKLEATGSKVDAKGIILRRLKWPLDKKEHQEAIVVIEALSQLINLSLTIDSWTILTKASEDVQSILGDVQNILGQLREHSQQLQSIEEHASQIQHSVTEQSQLLREDRDGRAQKAKQQLKEDILEWISQYDPQSKHDSVREPRVDGTGEWLLACDEFRNWRDSVTQPNTLWCQGIPGSGKSVLASLVIDELRTLANSDTPLAYVYLDYRDRESQKPVLLFGGILKQILGTAAEIPQSVVKLYERSLRSGSKLQTSDAQQAIFDTCESYERVYLVFDALDEAMDRETRSALLTTIKKLRNNSRVRLLVTSRPSHEDIQSTLASVPQLVIKAQNGDLRTYLTQRIDSDRSASVMNASFREEVIETILYNAQDMFLLPELQIRAVLGQPTKGHMKKVLRALPKDLPAALSKTILRIQLQGEELSRLAMDALMWISHAKEPIPDKILCAALAVTQSSDELDDDFVADISVIVESCCGLVMVNENDNLLRLCHFSVQEYLQDHTEELFPAAEQRILSVCLKYLSFTPFRDGPCESTKDLRARTKVHRFGAYAACVWYRHGRLLSDNRSIDEMLDFLNSADIAASAHQLMQYKFGYHELYWDIRESHSCTPLHFASLVGLMEIVKRLLALNKYDINAKTRMGTTALIKAASRNHTEIVRLLLQYGAETAISNSYGNALHCAAEAGACETISMLVDADMEVNCARRRVRRTPLHCAVDNDLFAAVSKLIDLGADMYAEDDYGLTPMEYAVDNEAFKSARVLLQRGYNMHWRTAEEEVPILFRMKRGERDLSPKMFNLLLEYGADLEARWCGDTVLLQAVHDLCWFEVKFLIERGARTDVRTVSSNQTLLEVAQAAQMDLEEQEANNGKPYTYLADKLQQGAAVIGLLRWSCDHAPGVLDQKCDDDSAQNPDNTASASLATGSTATERPDAVTQGTLMDSYTEDAYTTWDAEIEELVRRMEKLADPDDETDDFHRVARIQRAARKKSPIVGGGMNDEQREILIKRRDDQIRFLQQLLVERESTS